MVRAAETEQLVGCRVYLTNEMGEPFYFESTVPDGSAVRYEKQNWIRKDSVEYHTTLSAHPAVAKVPPGTYQLRIERGKTWQPLDIQVDLNDSDQMLRLSLSQWDQPELRGWYSGDTHLHRTPDELRNIVLAEDLNVALPLTQWVIDSDTSPSASDRNQDEIPEGLIEVDASHVIWPLNTEYEIFNVGKQPHTLGALFALGHSKPLELGVPPWSPVIAKAEAQNELVVFDMDKLDWPFSMLLPTLSEKSTYELTNNHVWRTHFAFRDWNSKAPSFMHPPHGSQSGGHRAWIDYTLHMYYTLLNAGLRIAPSAGTANGVHPVPAGFGRVYVQLPGGFNFEDWMRGLRAGRSFVTTGPVLDVQVQSSPAGTVLKFNRDNLDSLRVPIQMQIKSANPLLYGEVLVNGQPVLLLRPQNQKQATGALQTSLETSVEVQQSGWIAVRWWEDHPSGQVRFAHTAPWYVEVDDEPVRISRHEKQYLVDRMVTEMERSDGIVSEEGMAEYQQALEFYRQLPEQNDNDHVARIARPLTAADRDAWLDNMIVMHGFAPHEVRLATGLSYAEAENAVASRSDQMDSRPLEGQVMLLPYPGGRHPRRGFLDGAIEPQRETKISLFPPWKDGGYVVVDVPEAIFSNLGLTYLAHTHIPTIWDDANASVAKSEWNGDDQTLSMTKHLPNGIQFTSTVSLMDAGAKMRIDLHNGTSQGLSGMRVQVCNMLSYASGFQFQQPLRVETNGPVIAVRAAESDRWIISGWIPSQRTWSNPPVPCFHADPAFPDCAPGETVSVWGGMWFYEGTDIDEEMRRRLAWLSENKPE